MRLNSFDYFRAVAIMLVVAGHSFNSYWEMDSALEITFANLIIGATALFVFISGFFFHYVFFKKFDYATFIKKKAINVFVPYVVINTCLISAYIFFAKPLPMHEEVVNPADLTQLFGTWYTFILTGKIMDAYWYIPFIMLMFLLSPLHYWFISKLTSKVQLLITGVLLLVALYVHRPLWSLSALAHVQSVIYYTPVYLLGILYSIHKTQVDTFLQRKALLFAALAIITALIQGAVYSKLGNYAKPFMAYGGIDLMLLQKIFLGLALLAFFEKYNQQEWPWLKNIAAMSFAIYFLHPIIISRVNAARDTIKITWMPEWLMYFATCIFVFIACILIALAVKKLLKEKSSYLIGW